MMENQHPVRSSSVHGALRAVAAAALPVSLLLASCAPPAVKAPPAPADVSDCTVCHAGKGAYPDAPNVYQYWETSGHGLFLDRPQQRPTCDACHDLRGAAAAGHLDGKKGAPGPNPFHLVEGFIAKAPKTEWDFQVQFDNFCWLTCHQPAGIPDMRHERDADPAKGAVQMGTHASYERPLGGYPVDGDLAVFTGSVAAPFFVTCTTCHDPHGSAATSMTGKSNRMTRENYKEPPKMCSRCHI